MNKLTFFIQSTLLVLSVSACDSANQEGVGRQNESLFQKDLFIDTSISNTTLSKFKGNFTKLKLIQSLKRLKNRDKNFNKLLKEFEGNRLKINAIWQVEDKIMLSISLRNEWHLAISKASIEHDIFQLLNLSMINPSSGIE
ncbi:hypothetical protein [Alteromonas sp. ASW11-130]|uniref:hypothetical protein n=1 Tax=Alteromonas sp. ASW11-130 TaxID=3015775 RepID=UPI00224203EF|nr:hypothetical protein [Alteromonas sp. ASW11-130]MCW8091125.1 hypothetical protein [Alteromonas sp. ASW11-130]